MNPMTYEGEDLMNIITKVVMPTEVLNNVCSRAEIGQQKYATFVEERINTTEVNVWARMKKVQLKMWKSARKAVKHKLAGQLLELKDDRSLFARMLIVARTRSEINRKEAIGQHEFTALPRALFAMSGTLLPCTDKSKLVTGVRNKNRQIPLEPIVHALGVTKAAALPGFHAFTGADQKGRFAGKGKLTCWQALGRCPVEVVPAFAALGTSDELTTDTESAIEAFVCQLYEPGTAVVDVGDLRWRLFTKKQLEAQKLPPTRGDLHEAIARAHFQAMVWHQDDVPDPQLAPATEYGWKAGGDQLVPVTTKDPPAPATITHLIKCGCKKTKCRSNCSCRSQQLNCSEMCMCGADEETCDNVSQEPPMGIDDEEEDNDPLI